jgi:hypothetical protein
MPRRQISNHTAETIIARWEDTFNKSVQSVRGSKWHMWNKFIEAGQEDFSEERAAFIELVCHSPHYKSLLKAWVLKHE